MDLWGFHPEFFVLLMAFIVGVWSIPHLNFLEKGTVLILFVYLLADWIGTYMSNKDISNSIVYNISTTFSLTICFWIYSSLFQQKALRLILTALVFILPLFSIINLSFIQGIDRLNTLTIVPAGFLLAVFSYMWLRRRIAAGETGESIVIFCFVLANFIYYPVSSSVISLHPLYKYYEGDLILMLYRILNNVPYFIWTLLLIIGFLWKKRTMSSL